MPQSEARAWWDDVQHLRKDAPAGARPTALRLAEDERPEPREEPARLPSSRRRVLLVTEDAAGARRSPAVEKPLAPAPRRRPAALPHPVELLDASLGTALDGADARRPSAAARTPRPAARARPALQLASATPAAPAADLVPATRREARPARSTGTARLLASPDRLALYAVVLGLLLVMIAAASGQS